jgi:hypothetical protein
MRRRVRRAILKPPAGQEAFMSGAQTVDLYVESMVREQSGEALPS